MKTTWQYHIPAKYSEAQQSRARLTARGLYCQRFNVATAPAYEERATASGITLAFPLPETSGPPSRYQHGQ